MVLLNRRATAYGGIVLTIALAGCSSSGGNGNTNPPGGTTSPPPASTPASSGGALDAAAKQEITSAFTAFFDTKTSLQKSMAVLQHGAKFKQTLTAESHSPSAQNVTAKVSKIESQSANVAVVTFSLFSGGNTLLPNDHGLAVREGGKWKVAAQTFCALLTAEGTAPALCKDASITSLPN